MRKAERNWEGMGDNSVSYAKTATETPAGRKGENDRRNKRGRAIPAQSIEICTQGKKEFGKMLLVETSAKKKGEKRENY